MQKDKFDELFKRKLTGYEWEGELPDWSEIEEKIPRRVSYFPFWRAAVAAVLILGTCGWLGVHYFRTEYPEDVQLASIDKIPADIRSQIPAEPAISDAQNMISEYRPAVIEKRLPAASEKKLIDDVPAWELEGDRAVLQTAEKPDEPQTERSSIPRMNHFDSNGFGVATRDTYPAKRKQIKKQQVTMGLLASNFSAISKNDPLSNNIMYDTYGSINMAIDSEGRLGRMLEKDDLSGFKHRLPLRAGLTAGYEILPDLMLESGLIYSYHYSEFGQVAGVPVDGTQRLHFLGIPVNINYQLLAHKHFRLYAGAGAEMNINLHADQRFSLSGKNNSSDFRQKEPVWGMGINVGGAYRLFRELEIYLEPALMKYWSKGDLHMRWTDDKIAFNLNIGLRTLF